MIRQHYIEYELLFMQITTISSNVFGTSISLKNLNVYGTTQCSQRDSNQRPLDLKSRILPLSCVYGSFTIISVTSGKYPHVL